MTSERRAQKFHTDASSVGNFCDLFSDVISQKKQWWRRQMSCLLRLVLFTTPKLTPGDENSTLIRHIYVIIDYITLKMNLNLPWLIEKIIIFPCSFSIYQINGLTVIVNLPSPCTAFSKASLVNECINRAEWSSVRRMVSNKGSTPYTTQETHKKLIAKIVVAGMRLNLGVRGQGKKPSWR